MAVLFLYPFNGKTPGKKSKIFPNLKPSGYLSITSVAVIKHPKERHIESFDSSWLPVPGSSHHYREIKAGPSRIISTVREIELMHTSVCACLVLG